MKQFEKKNKEMEKLMSIVIPVYNMEKYLRRCLDSLILDDSILEKLEVLIINDGSKDSSSQIGHEYQERYPSVFQVIDKENGGHGSAWNVGVELATGKFLRFLDSDDWLELSNLAELLQKLETCDADLVFTHRNRFYEDTGEKACDKIRNISYGHVYKIDEINFVENDNSIEITNFWYCTYRTTLLKKLHPLFLEHIMFDDGILFVAPVIVASTFVCYDMALYNYLLGRSGQSMDIGVQKKHLDHRLKVQISMIDFVMSHSFSSKTIEKYLSEVLKGNIEGFTEQICSLPRNDRNKMLAEWIPNVNRVKDLYSPNKTITAYNRLPVCLFNVLLFIKKKFRKQ